MENRYAFDENDYLVLIDNSPHGFFTSSMRTRKDEEERRLQNQTKE